MARCDQINCPGTVGRPCTATIDLFNEARIADMGSPKDILARMRSLLKARASRALGRDVFVIVLISGEWQY